jgi:hypothetical protein
MNTDFYFGFLIRVNPRLSAVLIATAETFCQLPATGK